MDDTARMAAYDESLILHGRKAGARIEYEEHNEQA